jgi:GSH-dependent disulfide-bond oxidoreductase
MTALPRSPELHGARTGNCLRAVIALMEAGVDFVIHPVDLRRGEQRSSSLLALNPRGKVPVLVLREEEHRVVLTQSNAIMFYAAAQPRSTLIPQQAPTRFRVLEAFFHFSTDIICVNNAAFRLERADQAAGAEHLTEEYLALIEASEPLLSDAGFMGGDTFSLADIAAYTVVSSVADRLPWERLPRLHEWRLRVGERPAVRFGMHAFD